MAHVISFSKSGRVISADTRAVLQRTIEHLQESDRHLEASRNAHNDGLATLRNLSIGRYSNDVNLPQPEGGGKSIKTEGEEVLNLLLDADWLWK